MPTTLEIHPAIGIARVGSSEEFFIGPEPDHASPASYRDGAGQLKRQAARFRVFACERDEQGRLIRCTECTPDTAVITWEVHLVNRKAAAPFFLRPQSNQPNTNPTLRRNNATGQDQALPDRDLIIDPGPRSLTGGKQGPTFFETGTFKGTVVPLGEIWTDELGRLLVVGGFGTSESRPFTPIRHFADNPNWHDDTSDGPVRATLQFPDGRIEIAKPAWVIACQPDFAPEVSNLVTLYDLLYDLGVGRGLLPPAPTTPAFDRHVWPILQRAMGYQWVNHLAHANHGPSGSADFTAPQWKDLGDPTRGRARRRRVFRLLRHPDFDDPPPEDPAMPALLSDGYPTDPFPLPLTRVQYQIMAAWADDRFVPTDASAEPMELLPEALTRMALEACAGGAFFPGIEAGRRMRDMSIYMDGEPFRLSHDVLKPGELTQSMAVPWQADFFACAWEDSFSRGWWPAQRPDDVLMERPPHGSKPWIRGIHNMHDMIRDWDKLGIVVKQTTDDGSEIFVETERDPNGILGND